jgi:hypothetical protein
MKYQYTVTLSRRRLIALIASAFLVISGTAYGISVDNTPANGYLLCSNVKTHAVIFPGKLSCPSGYTNLELGAQGPAGQDGTDGQDGAQGPAGPAGSSSNWFGSIPSRDLVGTAGASSFAALKKTIIASIGPSNLNGGGQYVVNAELSGVWASQATTGSFIDCYFQDANQYPNGSINVGGATSTYSNWTNINLHVTGYPSDFSLSTTNTYLVCATNGLVSGLSGYLNVTAAKNLTNMNLGAAPAS